MNTGGIMVRMNKGSKDSKPGRPPKVGELRENKLPICLTETERQILNAAAGSQNKDTSVWVREVSLREAEKLKKAIDVTPREPIE
jgi:hypothetical protein